MARINTNSFGNFTEVEKYDIIYADILNTAEEDADVYVF